MDTDKIASATMASTGNNIRKEVRIDAARTAAENDSEITELTEADCYDELPFSWSKRKKWAIIIVPALIQISMNLNASLYSNGIRGMVKEFGISPLKATVGAAAFLVAYAFGCELWAPWSEELGRWPALQVSLLLINIFQLPVALSTNFNSVLIGRIFGGLSSTQNYSFIFKYVC
jgi:predicted MFS family arabinose efflux permease